MRALPIILSLLFAALQGTVYAGGNNVINQVTNGVCDCLETCKNDAASLKDKSFQGCIQKVAKPHIKELKKMFFDGKEGSEEQFAQELSLQLGMAMAEKCPAMLEFILQEFPELQGE